jgi:hypothetical protein
MDMTPAALPFARKRALRAAVFAKASAAEASAAWRRARVSLGPFDLARARALQTAARGSIHHALVCAFDVSLSLGAPRTGGRPIRMPTVRTSPPAPEPRQLSPTCTHCGVAVVGRRTDRGRMLALLAGHERFCPGGERQTEVWRPFPEPTPAVRRGRGRLRLVPGSHDA